MHHLTMRPAVAVVCYNLLLLLLIPCYSFSVSPMIPEKLPKLIVFDLDNTIWTPELYQLRKMRCGVNSNKPPQAGNEVQLFPGTQQILEEYIPQLLQQGIQLAVASRTNNMDWAFSLLQQFGLSDIISYVEIFPANKQQHFQNIQQASGISFQDMIFFDDARDGRYGNCEPVSMLGVFSVHCPKGIRSKEIFLHALDQYQQWDRTVGTILEADGTISRVGQSSNERKHQFGIIKMVNRNKRYGFIEYNNGTRNIFFHFNHIQKNDDSIVEQGVSVSFVTVRDVKTGKDRADKVAVVSASTDVSQVDFNCFSMNQPFAALLANGYKDIETRNGTMFTKYAPGTLMLLHVGKRLYPDGNQHVEIMKDAGLDDDAITKLKSLPAGFGKGNIVAIMELGRTFETTLEERSDPLFQRRVAAYGPNAGRMATEINRVAYLKKAVKTTGQAGVFRVKIDKSIVPEEWVGS